MHTLSKRSRHYLFSSIRAVTLVILVMLALQTRVYAAGLKLTLTTESQIYGLSETVEISGNLTFNDVPVGDGIVAIEVRDSSNLYFSFRTVPTGSTTPTSWLVNFTQLYPCDSNGNPKYTFAKSSTVSIFYEVKNHDIYSHFVRVAISIYDPQNVPIGAWAPSGGSLDPGESSTFFFGATQITGDSELGTYTIYANAYSEFPSSFGYPYCLEQTATFTVTSTTSGTGKETQNQQTTQMLYTDGTYNSSFKLPKVGRVGSYTIYVSSRYQAQNAFSNMAFPVVLIGDVNDDGYVEMMDFWYVASAYGSDPEAPNWDPRCDIYPWPDGDDYVEMMDFWLVSLHYGDHVL